MKLYYVGPIYDLTSTMYGELYHTDGTRSDWGKVQVAARSGDTVTIEPAPTSLRESIFTGASDFIRKTAYGSPNGWLHGVGNYETPPPHLELLIEGVLSKLRKALNLP